MNVDLAQELLNELGASLEDLETQHAALFHFLKDKGILTDDQIAPYLEQAAKVSGVRWRAAHIRLESFFRTERKNEEELRKGGSGQKGAGEVQLEQNQEPQAQTTNGSGSAKAAGRNEEAEASTNGAVEGNGKQPVPDDEHRSSE